MINFGFPCAYHSEEIITNFCKSNQCLLPLCPKCIRIHVQQHKQHNTIQNIQRQLLLNSIDISLNQVKQIIMNRQIILNQMGQNLGQLQLKKMQTKIAVKKKFKDFKERIQKEVNLMLDAQQKEMMILLEQYNQLIKYKLVEIDDMLRNNIEKIWKIHNGLSNDNALKSLIIYYSQNLSLELQKNFEQIGIKIKKVQNSKFDIVVRQYIFSELRKFLNSYCQIETTQHIKDQGINVKYLINYNNMNNTQIK